MHAPSRAARAREMKRIERKPLIRPIWEKLDQFAVVEKANRRRFLVFAKQIANGRCLPDQPAYRRGLERRIWGNCGHTGRV